MMQQQEMNDVIVVGAGIVGCAAAYHLARSGLRVTLLDKGSTAGEASQATAAWRHQQSTHASHVKARVNQLSYGLNRM